MYIAVVHYICLFCIYLLEPHNILGLFRSFHRLSSSGKTMNRWGELEIPGDRMRKRPKALSPSHQGLVGIPAPGMGKAHCSLVILGFRRKKTKVKGEENTMIG